MSSSYDINENFEFVFDLLSHDESKNMYLFINLTLRNYSNSDFLVFYSYTTSFSYDILRRFCTPFSNLHFVQMLTHLRECIVNDVPLGIPSRNAGTWVEKRQHVPVTSAYPPTRDEYMQGSHLVPTHQLRLERVAGYNSLWSHFFGWCSNRDIFSPAVNMLNKLLSSNSRAKFSVSTTSFRYGTEEEMKVKNRWLFIHADCS